MPGGSEKSAGRAKSHGREKTRSGTHARGGAVSARQARAAEVLADPRWARVRGRDPNADGEFFYSVESTGVYCRPSCAARPARPENVRFHATRQDAERAGFRPCKRCKPDQAPLAERQRAVVKDLCRFIESESTVPTLEALGQRAGLSPYHLQRLFKRVTGLSPRAYAAAQRAERVREELERGGRVTDAIYEAGYGSGGRFYERSSQLLGMTPTQYRSYGEGAQIRFAIAECSLGSVLVAATERGVCAITLGDEPEALVHDLERRFRGARLVGGDAAFEGTVARVLGLIEAPGAVAHGLPLDIRGTAFQGRVWEALSKVPPGTTTTYTELARAIGAPKAVRAVAQACAANPVAVAIPCHRVVRMDGALSGYRWGIERKRTLLARESEQR